MDTIAKRLDLAMSGPPFNGNQSAVSRVTSVPQPTINRILKDQTPKGPETETVRKLAAGLGVRFEWLMEGTLPMRPLEAREPGDQYNAGSDMAMPVTGRAPVVGIASGGPDGYINIDDYEPGNGDGFIESNSPDPSAYAIRVRGDSMRPRIRSGEFIVAEPGREAQQGSDVVVKLKDGRALVKEWLWTRDGEICLGSVNHNFQPLTIPLAEIDTIHKVAAILPRDTVVFSAARRTPKAVKTQPAAARGPVEEQATVIYGEQPNKKNDRK